MKKFSLLNVSGVNRCASRENCHFSVKNNVHSASLILLGKLFGSTVIF